MFACAIRKEAANHCSKRTWESDACEWETAVAKYGPDVEYVQANLILGIKHYELDQSQHRFKARIVALGDNVRDIYGRLVEEDQLHGRPITLEGSEEVLSRDHADVATFLVKQDAHIDTLTRKYMDEMSATAFSAPDAEVTAMAEGLKRHGIYAQDLFEFLLGYRIPLDIMTDSATGIAAIDDAYGVLQYMKRTQGVPLSWFPDNNIKKTSNDDNLADVMTKALEKNKFQHFSRLLGVYPHG
ncbi:unnamed protein product [Symbiodinium microadriaticum]|nr:unnamed protein product [Symbiodinium microadriaticum]CAE7858109.1 unnamed protein product [Symbiodinium sp. KB8]